MSTSPNVLAITRRPAQLCATQALLYGAGFILVTATNLQAACSVIVAKQVTAVIVCMDSWSAEERDVIAFELHRLRPQLAVIMRCPGCTGCDEAAGIPGVMRDERPLLQLIAAVKS